MYVLKTRNVHEVLPEAARLLRREGIAQATRNGLATRLPAPLTTVYQHPRERVVFWAERDANPFFHFFEALWMLAGRDDAEFPARFAKQIESYSDDGKTLNGAYGYRWRYHFNRDQLAEIIRLLTKDLGDRRVVLTMWDAAWDLGLSTKDAPCNLQAVFQVLGGRLDMMVTNRSNDLIWGAYGANAVHFSFLQEYVACALGVPVGTYYQVSMNSHAYQIHDSLLERLEQYAPDPFAGRRGPLNPYLVSVETSPLLFERGQHEQFDGELAHFFNGARVGFQLPFFSELAVPLIEAHDCYKLKKSLADAKARLLAYPLGTDWIVAARDWLERRSDRLLLRVP